MADKPLKSITFPGLADKYMIPEIDSTLTQQGEAADAKATGDAVSELRNTLSHKADLIYDTASGDIASFPDGADGLPVKDLTVGIESVQDLHGYDNPWPGGGGKNLLNIANGTSGTRRGVMASYDNANGLTFSGECDDSGWIGKYTLTDGLTLAAGTYSFSIKTALSYGFVFEGNGSSEVARISANSRSVTVTLSAETTVVGLTLREGVSGQSVSVHIEDIQIESGSLTAFAPYSNICPISGRTGCEVARTGKNLFYANSIANNGNMSVAVNDDVITLTLTAASKNRSAWYDVPAKQFIGKTVCLSGSQKYTGNNPGKAALRSMVNNTFTNLALSPTGDNTFSLSAIIPKCDYIRVLLGVTGNNSGQEIGDTAVYSNIQLEIGSTETAYEQYQGVTLPISWQSEAGTVYGGTLDVTSGVLTVLYGQKDLGSLDYTKRSDVGAGVFTADFSDYAFKSDVRMICSIFLFGGSLSYISAVLSKSDSSIFAYYSSGQTGGFIIIKDTSFSGDATAFKTAMTGQTLVYELATPLEYTLTAQQLTTLLGQNNIWADCGPSTVEYPCDTKLYIQKINTPTDDDMIADANIASGKYFIVNNNLYLSTAAILAGDPIKPGTNCTLTNLAAALNALNS